jgi:hypothetical protein
MQRKSQRYYERTSCRAKRRERHTVSPDSPWSSLAKGCHYTNIYKNYGYTKTPNEATTNLSNSPARSSIRVAARSAAVVDEEYEIAPVK